MHVFLLLKVAVIVLMAEAFCPEPYKQMASQEEIELSR
jgi:hypothetical protein